VIAPPHQILLVLALSSLSCAQGQAAQVFGPNAASRPRDCLGLQLCAEKTTINESDIEERGKKLREQLSRVYDELQKTQKLSGRGTDISDALPPFIFPGMSFREAEDTLRAAGFIIQPHPDLSEATDPNRATDWYGVLAVINPFRKLFLGHSELYVTLLPRQPGDYGIVDKVKATIFVSTL
jgi:hypothetical protein